MNGKRRRIAALDLGTNSLLLLVAERDASGRVTVLADESDTPRLGEGLRAAGRILPHALQRTCGAVARFAQRARALDAGEILLTATSAAREAANREEFLDAVAAASGIRAEILPPGEEARLTYLSCTAELAGDAPCAVVDIGGGSTEIAWGRGRSWEGGESLDLGTVKIVEEHLREDPPGVQALESARGEISARLAGATASCAGLRFGTAGSFTHLAAVDLALARYHPERVAGHKLTRARVRRWAAELARLTVARRKELPGVDPRRADVLLAGTLIIEGLFPRFGGAPFEVRDRGVRFGLLFDRLADFRPPVRFAKGAP